MSTNRWEFKSSIQFLYIGLTGFEIINIFLLSALGKVV